MKQRIEKLTRENKYLRQKFAYHKKTQVTIIRFYNSVQIVVQKL